MYPTWCNGNATASISAIFMLEAASVQCGVGVPAIAFYGGGGDTGIRTRILVKPEALRCPNLRSV
jgi:hypothetical protein